MSWDMGPCLERSRAVEWNDLPDTGDDDLEHYYDFMEFIDRRLGGDRIILGAFDDFSVRWVSEMPITVLELNCGRGALSRHLAAWARKRNTEVRILACDPNTRAVKAARDRHKGFSEIVFETRDFDDPQFLQAQQFDYVFSSLGLHRCPDDQAIKCLKTANRLAKRGMIAVDWIRDVRAFLWMSAISRLWGDAIVKHDAPLAIQRSFTLAGFEEMAAEAGIDPVLVRRHFGYRMSIVSERGLVMSPAIAPMTGLAGT